jgi:hypothetical protein
MKNIQPITTWVNGQNVTATIFNLQIIGGQLHNSASFYYELRSATALVVSQGNLTLAGEDYQAWGLDDDYPYVWAAGELNLVITGDYIEAAPEPIIEPEVSEDLESDIE